jgi:transketolase C-terminal domain/subunit
MYTPSRWEKAMYYGKEKISPSLQPSIMVSRAMEAADQLAAEGIDVEIIRPAHHPPPGYGTDRGIHHQNRKVLIVHEAVKMGGLRE